VFMDSPSSQTKCNTSSGCRRDDSAGARVYTWSMFIARARSLRLAALALLALAVSPALAQQPPPQPRRLDVPATAAWQHAATQIILRPEAAGLRRVDVRDTTSGELDIIADYVNQAEGIVATVYLYRTSVADAALWFDRALTAIRLRPGWGLEAAPPPAVTAFAPPGASVASGLRTAFDVGAPEVRSTALAVAPLGDFLFKIRISSTRLDAAGQAMRIEGLDLGGGGGRRFSMRLLDRGTTSALPSFNRLPPPDQAIAVAFGHRGDTVSVSTGNDPER
jgi:hypothetical protein